MAMFKQKTRRKIHLSPRLADHAGIGRKTKKVFAIFAVFAAVMAVGQIRQEKRQWQSLSQAAVQGEVLGAQTTNSLDYTIQSGDTLVALSEHFKVHWTAIVEENEIAPPYKLYPGQIIRIPVSHD